MNTIQEWEPGEYITPVHEDVESTLDNENWMPFTDVFETGAPSRRSPGARCVRSSTR